jgi:hypothetical protein
MLTVSTIIKYFLLKVLWLQKNHRHRTILSNTQFAITKHILKSKVEVIYENS